MEILVQNIIPIKPGPQWEAWASPTATYWSSFSGSFDELTMTRTVACCAPPQLANARPQSPSLLRCCSGNRCCGPTRPSRFCRKV